MTNLDTGPGQIGAKRQSWQEYNPREVLRTVIKENPSGSEKTIHDAVKDALFADAGYLDAIFEYWFTNNYRAFAGPIVDPGAVEMRRVQRDTIREQIKQRHAEYVQQILMDQILSNGKLLRDATFGDCKKEGGWYTDLGKAGKANQIVGKQLTEEQVANLRKRHYGK